MRVFLDANILFSAAYREHSLAALLIALGRAKSVALVSSNYAMDEARRNLQAKSPESMSRHIDQTSSIEHIGEPPPKLTRLAEQTGLPAKDAPILAAAWVTRATHLVTGDRRHFAGLYGREMHGTRIVRLREAFDLIIAHRV